MTTVASLGVFGILGVAKVPLKYVYAVRTIPHAILLQSKLPTTLIALPAHVSHQDVNRYAVHLRFPFVCSRAGLLHPTRCLEILQYTDCRRLLVANVLVEFDEGMEKVVGHEEVEVVEAR
jgi:hypothetical protein